MNHCSHCSIGYNKAVQVPNSDGGHVLTDTAYVADVFWYTIWQYN